jgi:hypothetical protein
MYLHGFAQLVLFLPSDQREALHSVRHPLHKAKSSLLFLDHSSDPFFSPVEFHDILDRLTLLSDSLDFENVLHVLFRKLLPAPIFEQ